MATEVAAISKARVDAMRCNILHFILINNAVVKIGITLSMHRFIFICQRKKMAKVGNSYKEQYEKQIVHVEQKRREKLMNSDRYDCRLFFFLLRAGVFLFSQTISSCQSELHNASRKSVFCPFVKYHIVPLQ